MQCEATTVDAVVFGNPVPVPLCWNEAEVDVLGYMVCRGCAVALETMAVL